MVPFHKPTKERCIPFLKGPQQNKKSFKKYINIYGRAGVITYQAFGGQCSVFPHSLYVADGLDPWPGSRRHLHWDSHHVLAGQLMDNF